MVGLLPIKALARHQQDLLFVQQIKSKLLIVGDVEFLRVDFREDVEAALGLYCGDAINAVKGAKPDRSRYCCTCPSDT